MGGSHLIHKTSALHPGKEHSVTIESQSGWAAKTFWTLGEDRTLSSARNRTLDRVLRSLVTTTTKSPPLQKMQIQEKQTCIPIIHGCETLRYTSMEKIDIGF